MNSSARAETHQKWLTEKRRQLAQAEELTTSTSRFARVCGRLAAAYCRKVIRLAGDAEKE